jgi:hypothetical protein
VLTRESHARVDEKGSSQESVVLRYGPLRVRFVGERGVLVRVVYPHTLFRDGTESPDCEVRCRFGQPRPFDSAPVFRAKTVWELRRDRDGREQVYFERREADGRKLPLMSLTIEPGFTRAELTRRGVEGDEDILVGYPIDEYLVARMLGRHGGVILHASSVAIDGRAFVFLGHSGAGKSTMAEIASACGAEVLSDDRTIVTIERGVATAWGSPWHGSCSKSSPICAPIAAVLLLVQAPRNEVRQIDASRAFSEMFVRVYQPTVDAGEVERVVDVLHFVASAVPSGELEFLPNETAFHVACRLARG